MSEVVHPGLGLCPLIDTLPTEIRIQIYEYILFENGSFFALDDEEGKSVPTLFPKLRAPPKRREPAPRNNDEVQAISRGPRKGNIMPLLLTSKQMQVANKPTCASHSIEQANTRNPAMMNPLPYSTAHRSSAYAELTPQSSSSTPSRPRTSPLYARSSSSGTIRAGSPRPSTTRPRCARHGPRSAMRSQTTSPRCATCTSRWACPPTRRTSRSCTLAPRAG